MRIVEENTSLTVLKEIAVVTFFLYLCRVLINFVLAFATPWGVTSALIHIL